MPPGHDKAARMEPLLLVEDKTELRAMLRKALERDGYKVDEAPDGTAAIAKVRARRYLLVLDRLETSGRSGLEVLRESKLADPSIARHSDHRFWLGGRSRNRDERRRLRLHPKAGGP